MKRIITLSLALALCLSLLSGCGSKPQETPSGADDTPKTDAANARQARRQKSRFQAGGRHPRVDRPQSRFQTDSPGSPSDNPAPGTKKRARRRDGPSKARP